MTSARFDQDNGWNEIARAVAAETKVPKVQYTWNERVNQLL